MLVQVKQIEPNGLTAFIQAATTGSAFAAALNSYIGTGGYLGSNVVYASGVNQTVSGDKTFVISPTVPYTGSTGRTVARLYVDDQVTALNAIIAATSGVLTGAIASASGASSAVHVTGSSTLANVNLTGLGGTYVFVSGQYVCISGASAGGGGGGGGNIIYGGMYTSGNQVVSGFTLFTGSPWVANPTAPSGAANLSTITGASGFLAARDLAISGVLQAAISAATPITNNFINSGTITGNFIDGSFFCDPVATGLNLFETHISHSFYFTGAAFACRTSGSGPANGGILSGKLYQVDSNNTEQTLFQFTYTSGVIYSGSPLFSTLFTGRNRLGLSITNSLSGIEKFSVGYFGGSYV